jgi:hypothetical protein
LQSYRLALRNWPASQRFPSMASRPALMAEEQAPLVRKKRVRKPAPSKASSSA